MKDITPLFGKKLVIWGIGKRGHAVLEEIISMGAGGNGIFLCDSDCKKWGSVVCGQFKIWNPIELYNELQETDLRDIVILVPIVSTTVQDEILGSIRQIYGEKVTVYTDYAIEYGMYLNMNHPCIRNEYRIKKLHERERKIKELEEHRFKDRFMLEQSERVLKYFTFLPLHNDEIILVYQCGKVGSVSVYNSIASAGRNVLHCHDLTGIRDNDDDLYRLINLKSGKIICLVRDPVARGISAMWQNIHRSIYYHGIDVGFPDLDSWCLSAIADNCEFHWFDEQMKAVFHIDVFGHKFDQENGYSIIRDGNIELLLIKLERLNKLEDVIGKFLNIGQFHLQSGNVGGEKSYRFALQDYKKEFCISEELLKKVYKDDKCIKHFYTEQECQNLYEKWRKCVPGKK